MCGNPHTHSLGSIAKLALKQRAAEGSFASACRRGEQLQATTEPLTTAALQTFDSLRNHGWRADVESSPGQAQPNQDPACTGCSAFVSGTLKCHALFSKGPRAPSAPAGGALRRSSREKLSTCGLQLPSALACAYEVAFGSALLEGSLRDGSRAVRVRVSRQKLWPGRDGTLTKKGCRVVRVEISTQMLTPEVGRHPFQKKGCRPRRVEISTQTTGPAPFCS